MKPRNEQSNQCPTQNDPLAQQIWDDPALVEALSKVSGASASNKSSMVSTGIWLTAACFILAVTTFLLWPTSSHVSPSIVSPSQMFVTGTAKREQFILEDGTSIAANASTSLEVTFSETSRRVTMTQGEAFFDVAKHPNRPFEISTKFGEITVLGTAFNIDTDSMGAEIRVFEGVVSVASNGRNIELTVGQQVVADSLGNLTSVTNFNAQVEEDWMAGTLRADNMSMRRIVDRMNRYTDKPIYLAPGIAQRSVTGAFSLSRPTESLKLLSELYDLRIEENHNSYYLTPQH